MNETASVFPCVYSRIRTDFSRNPFSERKRERERITPLLNRRFSKSCAKRFADPVSYNPIFPSGGGRTKERRDTRNEKSNVRRITFWVARYCAVHDEFTDWRGEGDD